MTRNVKHNGVMIPAAMRIKVEDDERESPNQVIFMESDSSPEGRIHNGGQNIEEDQNDESSMAQMRIVRSCESSKF